MPAIENTRPPYQRRIRMTKRQSMIIELIGRYLDDWDGQYWPPVIPTMNVMRQLYGIDPKNKLSYKTLISAGYMVKVGFSAYTLTTLGIESIHSRGYLRRYAKRVEQHGVLIQQFQVSYPTGK